MCKKNSDTQNRVGRINKVERGLLHLVNFIEWIELTSHQQGVYLFQVPLRKRSKANLILEPHPIKPVGQCAGAVCRLFQPRNVYVHVWIMLLCLYNATHIHANTAPQLDVFYVIAIPAAERLRLQRFRGHTTGDGNGRTRQTDGDWTIKLGV